MTITFRFKPIITLTAVILFTTNCRLGAKSDAKEFEAAFKAISRTAADTNKISAINQPLLNISPKGTPTPLKNMFGINAYEWNFLENPGSPNDRKHIYEDNMSLVKTFSAVRHYLNWNRVETTKGNYTFNPTNNGSWDEDIIYQRCKQDGILVFTIFGGQMISKLQAIGFVVSVNQRRNLFYGILGDENRVFIATKM